MRFLGRVLPYRCMASGALRVPIEIDCYREFRAIADALHGWQGKILEITVDGIVVVHGEFATFSHNPEGNFVVPFEVPAIDESRVIGPISRIKNGGGFSWFDVVLSNDATLEARRKELRSRAITRLHAIFREIDKKNGYPEGHFKTAWKKANGIESVSGLNDIQITWAIDQLTADIINTREHESEGICGS